MIKSLLEVILPLAITLTSLAWSLALKVTPKVSLKKGSADETTPDL